MNTHEMILAELEKYEGGKFVPVRYGETIAHDGVRLCWTGEDSRLIRDTEDCCAYIERAAFRAVMHWCKERDIVLHILESHEIGWRLKTHTGIVIASDLDEHSMWLSAMAKINGGGK